MAAARPHVMLGREVSLASTEEANGLLGAAQPETGLLVRLRRSHLALLWATSLVATAVATRRASAAWRGDARAPSAVGEVTQEWGWGEEPSLWPDYTNFFDDAKFIDLTHAFEPQSPSWEGFGPSTFGPGKASSHVSGFAHPGDEFTYEEHGFITTAYSLSSDQLGTHVDPPAAWNEYGATTSDFPATYALRQLVVIDVSDKVRDDAGYEVTRDDVLAWEADYGTVPEGSVVFIRTDWSRSWGDYATDGLPRDFPGVGLQALKLLHEERHILFHGHEPMDTDQTPDKEGEAWLMHSHFAQAEGLTNLDQVQVHGCLLSTAWAKVLGGTGGFARFVAICPDAPGVGGDGLEEPGQGLQEQFFPLRRNDDGVLVPTQGAQDSEYCRGSAALGCLDGIPTWDEVPMPA